MTSDKGVVERLQRELAEAQSGHDAARQTFHIMQGAANSLRIRAENAEARIETLERALHQIIRMKTVPNDGINTFTLAAVHHVAETALSPSTNTPEK